MRKLDEETENFSPPCLSLDLEVKKQNNRIYAFAALRSDTGESISFDGNNLLVKLVELDDLANGTSFLLGHNLIKFDLPHLVAANPNLRLLKLPSVDTLWLSPLAFPRNPYHRLVKHYKDAGLKRSQRNNPYLDSEIALELFYDEREALEKTETNLLVAWHWLSTVKENMSGFDMFFSDLRLSSRPSDSEAQAAISRLLEGNACRTQINYIMQDIRQLGWDLAYALAWLSVSGGNSVMPPWVCHQFPEAGRLIRRLRDTACTYIECVWCRERHDARKELTRWFGFPDFRQKPTNEDGSPMQQSIVEDSMARKHVLGIMPTGAGKSLCYQIPALSRYDKTGALTIVISPLVALMADQVTGLEDKGISSCATINGLLSVPERRKALERVRLGDASILIISPEGLRNQSIRRAIDHREIGGWVIDEAHCLSKWGHDFRPDYRYVGRFIRQKAKNELVPPILCLTATAKIDVIEEIKLYFHEELDIELNVFNGGAHRPNLKFEVEPTTEAKKFARIHEIIKNDLPASAPGGAIIYCATRQQSENVAMFLVKNGLQARYFHAGLPPETKKNIQQSFIEGSLRVIVATNAFGMGIDKPDVRIVIHADMPGSLENYMQEAGRAGRDQDTARCVMLYDPEDVERQFGMSAFSRLTRRDIQGILRALRRLDRKKRLGGKVVATAGEMLIEDEDKEFRRDSVTDDTRVRTAISWLEEAKLLTREENLPYVFPSSLQIDSVTEARKRLERKSFTPDYCRKLISIVETIMNAEIDEGISTDQLMHVSGLTTEGVNKALHDLESLGIASNDLALTAYVHSGVEHSSRKRLEEAKNLEIALIKYMREIKPDIKKGEKFRLSLRVAAQELREQGFSNPLPRRLLGLLYSMAYDGRGEGGDAGSLGIRSRDRDAVWITLQREWNALEKTAEVRRAAANLLLNNLLAYVPRGTRGIDILVDTTLGELLKAIKSDIAFRAEIKAPVRLQNCALLWLHEQSIIRLNRGLTVFRPAMTIHLEKEKRRFTNVDFEPLALHYQGQVLQIHIMAEFARRGVAAMSEALKLVLDYFNLKRDDFLHLWLPGKQKELARETTPESWRAIVESLNNPTQQRIVADDGEETNVLVLAGPGSGKTRVLVHRIAYLVRIRRESPRSIMALAYNRHAAVDIRRRLKDLVGNDSLGVTVLTCHALAMRLVGMSLAKMEKIQDEEGFFSDILRQATALLRGEGAPPEESDEQRERLLSGFRWILVDEYQDIGSEEYDLISALAGRTLDEQEGKLTLFAVGDDDQNIYAFKGASVEFIRRFEQDYESRPAFLIENYRSTRHIITAANSVIESARERMKIENPIRINRARSKEPQGGEWEKLDPVVQGRVQVLPTGHDMVSQAYAVITEIQRLSSLSSDWNWSKCAVIAREWKYLVALNSLCEINKIPVQMANEEIPSFWRLRETRMLIKWLQEQSGVTDSADLDGWLDTRPPNYWNDLLRQAVEEYSLETGGASTPVGHFIEWLAEWCREIRRSQRGLMLLTAHRAKGLEFDHIVILDGGWQSIKNNKADEERRLYYVAMTRARKTLTLSCLDEPNRFQTTLINNDLAILRDKVIGLSNESKNPRKFFRKLKLSDVHLSFTGYKDAYHKIHQSISALSCGDPLSVRVINGRWELLDLSGTIVGQLAKKFKSPDGMRCDSAKVFAIVTRSRDDSELRYRSSTKCDEWEVVVPELVFVPDKISY